MILISHRGNITEPKPEQENSQPYIQAAIDSGYDVEIDVRFVNGLLFLGHDDIQYRTDLFWLLERRNKLWIHAKDFAALDYLIDYDLRVFYHQHEKHTVIGNTQLIWSHDLSEASNKSIIPLISLDDIRTNYWKHQSVHGICSDYVTYTN